MLSMTQGLLIVDIQRDYFPGGAYPLVEPEAAADAAQRILSHFRTNGSPVIHVQHVWDDPDATFMRPGTAGIEIHPKVAPIAGEPVIQKTEPNSFLGTTLLDELKAREIDSLVVVGMMSSMCVDSTVRAGTELEFDITVIHDACAAPDLEFLDQQMPGATVHACFMAALGDGYATVVSADNYLS
jgi:nicotinamidase-related amidase